MACMPDTLGRRHSGDADTWISCRYEVYTNSVIGGTFAGHRPHVAGHVLKCFHSTVLHGVVTEQQYGFFREYRNLQVTSTTRNLVNTAKDVNVCIMC